MLLAGMIFDSCVLLVWRKDKHRCALQYVFFGCLGGSFLDCSFLRHVTCGLLDES